MRAVGKALVDAEQGPDRRLAAGRRRSRSGAVSQSPGCSSARGLRAHHPGDLVPPRDVRPVEEAGGQEEDGRQPVGAQHRVGQLVVVAVAVVERQRDVAAAPRRERRGQLVARHDLHVAGEEAQLAVEVVLRRAPQRAGRGPRRRARRCGGSRGRARRATSGGGPGRPRDRTARAPSATVSPRPTVHRLRGSQRSPFRTMLLRWPVCPTRGARRRRPARLARSAAPQGSSRRRRCSSRARRGLLTRNVSARRWRSSAPALRPARPRSTCRWRSRPGSRWPRSSTRTSPGRAPLLAHGAARRRLARHPAGARSPCAPAGTGRPGHAGARPAARVDDAVDRVGERSLAGVDGGQDVVRRGGGASSSSPPPWPHRGTCACSASRSWSARSSRSSSGSPATGDHHHRRRPRPRHPPALLGRRRRPELPRRRPRGGDRARRRVCCRRSAIRSPSSDSAPRSRPSPPRSRRPSRAAG